VSLRSTIEPLANLRSTNKSSARFAYFAYSMSCCSVVFCVFVVYGSVCGVLGCCRLFGLGFISFFIRKLVAVPSLGLLRFVGQARQRACSAV
jgi:hypothetical protein